MNKLGQGIKESIRQACLLPRRYCKLLGDLTHLKRQIINIFKPLNTINNRQKMEIELKRRDVF